MILIKANHPYAYKSKQWGQIVNEFLLDYNKNGEIVQRPCFDIMWPDGDTDVWPQVDPTAEYEFKEVEHALDTAEIPE